MKKSISLLLHNLCMCVHLCACVYVCVHACVSVCVSTHMSVYVCVHVCLEVSRCAMVCMWRSEDTLWSRFSPTMWLPAINLK